MLYMVMHKADDQNDSHWNPDPKLVADMGQLVGESLKQGIFKGGDGLQRSAERIRLTARDGKVTTTKGPFEPRAYNELVAGFASLRVRSMDEAVEWAKKFAAIVGDVELEIGPVVEPWHLGLMEKPAHAPLRVLALHMGDAEYEAGKPRSPETAEKVDALVKEMQAEGVYQSGASLRPSSKGARLKSSGGRHSWTDGPFAESKELVAGFSILELPGLDEVKEFTDRYADILGDCEVDVRVVDPDKGLWG